MRYTGAPERTVIAYEDVAGNPVDVSPTTALPVTGGGGGGGGGGSGLTDAELRAEAVPVTDGAAGSLLWRILQVLLSPLGYDRSLQRQRGTVILESGTVTTVTNVQTVANLTNIDGYNGRMQVLGQNATAWQACVRARIT